MGGLLVLLLFIPKMSRASYYTITDWLIPSFESFSATPYWDVSRYSWGYGTPAPGSTGTITREQALVEMRKHIDNDYAYLQSLISRNLSANQWAALLSFTYNEGQGNGDNLVPNINAGDDAALETQWKLYNKVHAEDGSLYTSDDLVDRRNKEWQIWQGSV